MLAVGNIIPYLTMCAEEGINLQRGMNFHYHTDKPEVFETFFEKF